MRLSGLLLLAVGAALCLSIDWAAIGFLAMALGLICVQIPIGGTSRSDAASGAIAGAPVSVEHVTATPEHGSARDDVMEREPQSEGLASNDPLKRDADLADVERLLARYGALYVDQFRRLYDIFNSKTLLPSILKLIAEAARQEAGVSEDIREKSPVPNEREFEDSPSSLIRQPIAVSHSTPVSPLIHDQAVNSLSENAKLTSRFEGLPGEDEPTEATKDRKAVVDSDALASFRSILDQLNQSNK
jgi:hypothetical protein